MAEASSLALTLPNLGIRSTKYFCVVALSYAQNQKNYDKYQFCTIDDNGEH
jgi:hypothetical protein